MWGQICCYPCLFICGYESKVLPVFRLCKGTVIRASFKGGWRKAELTKCLRNKREYRITISVPKRRRAELVKTSCPASFWHRIGPFMNFLRLIFGRKEQWVEFDTLYSTRRLERLRIFMAENNIPYKVWAALLLVPLNTPMPTGAVTQSLWYIVVHCSSFRGRPPGAALSSHRKGYLRWSSYRHVCC